MSDINVTPFVDIILVVLIIFMVTTPIIMKPSINVNLPKAASGEQTNPTQLSITITAVGQIVVNGTVVTEGDVGNLAKELIAKNPDVQALISADKDVPHGKVIGVIDAVKSAGVTRFAISIEKK
ncbi:MAG: biopolymer transporter ExbD [Proteobacteria bacterium SG_bin7]|nr:MAG: biopolymer transporter ExbD [Proteobacteria bacterium SG_bin7]